MRARAGRRGRGSGCRPLGRVANARPLIDHAGKTRKGLEADDLYAAAGIMVGEVTDSSALVQIRLTASDKLVDGDVPGHAGVVSSTPSAFSTTFFSAVSAMKFSTCMEIWVPPQ